MKNIISIALVLLVQVTASFALEENWLGEKPEWMPEVSLTDSFYTKYIWRGQNLGNEPVMQTDFSLSKGGFTFDLWTNYSLNNDKTVDGGRFEEYTEIDYNIDYTFSLGEMLGKVGVEAEKLDPMSLSLGYTYYTFPNVNWDSKGFDTHEVYLGVAYDILLQPYLKWYWDVDSGKGVAGEGTGNGSYYLAGIGHTFEFDETGITADIGMSIAYNDQQWTHKSGWSDMNFSGSVSIPVLTYFTISPSVGYSVILDEDVYSGAQENEFYGGLSIGFAY
ncbi:MAG: hypothetical protein HQL29_05755 [Candidatus Omnitrophica bacterium]|nr:hypothetical protein [Candidatus Omnitrophota bacterium]